MIPGFAHLADLESDNLVTDIKVKQKQFGIWLIKLSLIYTVFEHFNILTIYRHIR